MNTQYKYKAFISYSHADSAWAKWLHRRLETYRTPKRLRGRETTYGSVPARLNPIFRDRDELATSHSLSDTIKTALSQSENLIIICSPQAAQSKWVNQEVLAFKQLGRSAHIFCFVVNGEPGTPGQADDCFVPALRAAYNDAGQMLQNVAEPIAADAREIADGKKLALTKIIAGLLGVELDDLLRREQHRRNQRMAFITAGSLAASVVTITLAVNATLARNEAQQRQQQAEELLGFMVGDLRESLTPMGRLDILESVGQKAMDYFATVDVSQLTEGELLRQAQVLTQLGEIRFEQFKYTEAQAAFMEAYERSDALYQRVPTDGERLFNRAQAEFWVGYVAMQSGSLKDSSLWLTKYRDSSLKLHDMNSDNDDWLNEVAYGHHNLAVIDFESGNLQEAFDGFQHEVAILSKLMEKSVDPVYITGLADANSWIGSIYLNLGNLASAKEYYKDSLEIHQSLYLKNTDNLKYYSYVAYAYQKLASIQILQGDMDSALVSLDAVEPIIHSLLEIENASLDWQRLKIRNNVKRSYVFVSQKRWDDALTITESALADFDTLLHGLEKDYGVLELLSNCYYLKATALFNINNFSDAMSTINNGIDISMLMSKETQLNDERLGTLGSSLVLRGSIYASEKTFDLANQSWQESLSLLSERIQRTRSPFILDPWIRANKYLGKEEGITEAINTLAENGYQPLYSWQY